MDPEQLSFTYSGCAADDLLSSDFKTRTNDIVQFCHKQLDKFESDLHNLLESNETLKLKIKEKELGNETLGDKLWTLRLYSKAEIKKLKNDVDEIVKLHEKLKVLELEIENKLLAKVDKLQKRENTLKQVNISLSSELALLTAENSELRNKKQQSKEEVNNLKSAFQHQIEESELTLLQNHELIESQNTQIVHLKELVEELYDHLNDKRQTIKNLQHKLEQRLEDQTLQNLEEQLSLSNTLEEDIWREPFDLSPARVSHSEDNLEENNIVSECQVCPENPKDLTINDDNNKQQHPTVPVSDINQPLCNSSSTGNEEQFSDSGFISQIHSSNIHENDQSSLLSDITEQPGTSSQNITVQLSISADGNPGFSSGNEDRLETTDNVCTSKCTCTAPQSKTTSLRKCFLFFGAVALSATIGYMLGAKGGAS